MKISTVHTARLSSPIVLALSLAASLLAVSVPSTALAASKLILNGKVVSQDVRVVNGSPYVKLADVAKGLGLELVKRADGSYEMKKAGGTSQVQGVTQGKIGDLLFDGKWRFRVFQVETPDSYTLTSQSNPDYAIYNAIAEFALPQRTFTAKPDYKLVNLRCEVTNGRSKPYALWVYSGDTRTALLDTAGTSYPPIAYDFDGAPQQSKTLLPGAKLAFNLLFSVPTTTQVKDLVFTLTSISEKGNDVRVFLNR